MVAKWRARLGEIFMRGSVKRESMCLSMSMDDSIVCTWTVYCPLSHRELRTPPWGSFKRRLRMKGEDRHQNSSVPAISMAGPVHPELMHVHLYMCILNLGKSHGLVVRVLLWERWCFSVRYSVSRTCVAWRRSYVYVYPEVFVLLCIFFISAHVSDLFSIWCACAFAFTHSDACTPSDLSKCAYIHVDGYIYADAHACSAFLCNAYIPKRIQTDVLAHTCLVTTDSRAILVMLLFSQSLRLSCCLTKFSLLSITKNDEVSAWGRYPHRIICHAAGI